MVYNTLGLRFLAVLIDNALLLPLAFMTRDESQRATFMTVLILLLEHSYFIIGNAQYGRTIGKRLLGLKVVRAHQHLPITWKHAIMRELYWIVLSVIYAGFVTDPTQKWAMVPAMIMFIADLSLAAIHPQNRSLRDFIAKTVVIRSAPNSPTSI